MDTRLRGYDGIEWPRNPNSFSRSSRLPHDAPIKSDLIAHTQPDHLSGYVRENGAARG